MPHLRRTLRTVALSLVLTAAALTGPAASAETPTPTPVPTPTGVPTPLPTPTLPTPSPSPTPTPPAEPVNKTLLLGRSARGVPIYAYRRNAINSARRVLVLGSIHGDEDAAKRAVYALRDNPGGLQRNIELWLVPTLNPDGNARRTRGNGRGVDLNRNFPYAWQYDPDRRYYSGPSAASEPETKALVSFLRSYHPKVELIFHQPLACVDLTSSTREASSIMARNLGLPMRTLGWRHGSQERFAKVTTDHSIAMTVELGWHPSTSQLGRVLTGIRQVANSR
jgi:hypothetical protein